MRVNRKASENGALSGLLLGVPPLGDCSPHLAPTTFGEAAAQEGTRRFGAGDRQRLLIPLKRLAQPARRSISARIDGTTRASRGSSATASNAARPAA